ncbi:hypothetical protein FGO68_gene12776 [Halteria grandinella]|uniref:Uncharacterized protein n=1 Tax=Halteria grandinella TaxID=5974 RepID=A0A8J8NFE6_HALGN|nr:hypothetical protein FGO68_gene12776 [Halteria grandinella]
MKTNAFIYQRPTVIPVERSFARAETQKRRILSQYLSAKNDSTYMLLPLKQMENEGSYSVNKSCLKRNNSHSQKRRIESQLKLQERIARPKSVVTLPTQQKKSKQSINQSIGQITVQENPARKPKNSYLESQKDKLVKRFHKSLTHDKAKMHQIQSSLAKSNQHLQNTTTQKVAQSRNNNNTYNYMTQTTNCDTDPYKCSSTIKRQTFDSQLSLMGTATFKVYFDEKGMGQAQAKNVLKSRHMNYSSNSKSSKRYEHVNTTHSEDGEVSSHENSNQIGKIRSICQLVLASRQNSKENLPPENKQAQLIGDAGKCVQVSNDSLYNAMASCHHQESAESSKQERDATQMSLEVAKIMIERKRSKYLQSEQNQYKRMVQAQQIR